MTLGELHERIELILHNNIRAKDAIVCIPNNKGGMGGTSVTNVSSAHTGIDWDAGKFMLYPENKMVELKTINQ